MFDPTKLNWTSGNKPICHMHYQNGACNSMMNDADVAFSLRKYRYWFLMIGNLNTALPEAEYKEQKRNTQNYFRWIKQRCTAAAAGKCGLSADTYTGRQLCQEPGERDGTSAQDWRVICK